jgi:hypothetical protein
LKEYDDYQNKLKDLERKEAEASEAIEQHVPALFVLVFAFISGAATFYLNEAGMKHSPLYDRTIGSSNAAFLVLFTLEGSFLALTLIGHRILKSQPQRESGKTAIMALKVVLSLNVLVAFVMLAGFQSMMLPAVRFYAQWGTPITVIGAGWLWAHIVVNRRKTILRDAMLDDSAAVERLWAEQHRLDQDRYRTAYQKIAGSQEMTEMREELAVRAAIEQIAREGNISFQDAQQIYFRQEDRRQGLSAGGNEGKVWPRW